MTKICIGFKAHMGWVNAVAVAINCDTPEPLWVNRVDLVDRTDREAYEPYHVAGGWQGLQQVPRPKNPQAVIDRGRSKQLASATRVLRQLRQDLKGEGLVLQQCVMLTTRSIVYANLEEALAYHSHIHVAEGEAIRDATRGALKQMRLRCIGQDEKSIADEVSARLGWSNPDQEMKSRRPEGTRKWSKEERTVALGAWLHANDH